MESGCVLDVDFVLNNKNEREQDLDKAQKRLNEIHFNFLKEYGLDLKDLDQKLADGKEGLRPLIFSTFLIEFFDIKEGVPLGFLDNPKEGDAVILEKIGFTFPNSILDWFVLNKNKKKECKRLERISKKD